MPNDSSTSTREGHPIRVAVVGLGEVAKVHLAAFSLVPKARLEAVCDSRADVVHQISNELGVRGYVGVAEMIQAVGIDLVMILTPAATHRAIIEIAAAAEIDVFCEKPIATSLRDAEEIVARCQQASIRCFYGSSYKYLPAIRTARELIKTGTLGDAQLLSEVVVSGNGLDGYSPLPFFTLPEKRAGRAG
ncbi:Gfo/Idh/MocA family oxidoreductase [Mesorhizobium sp. C280B]|uniref:Gfo/Idh/MocA family protein n=1 Tax=Mesorhizobium sp. C280B TaxID=2956828 RepID=UPI00333760C5